MSTDEILRRGSESPSKVTRRLAEKVNGLLARLAERLETEGKRAEVVRLRGELAAAKAVVRQPQRPMTTAIAAECVRLYTVEGLTIAEVGDRVDRPWSSVRRALVSAGVSMRHSGWSRSAGSGQ